MPKNVVDILTKLQSEAKEGYPFLFLTEKRWQLVREKWHKMRKAGNGNDWQNEMLMNNILRNFKSNCKAAGIKTNDKLTVHCLRKAFGTNLANLSTPIQTLKSLMGHASIQTTMEFYLYSSDANEQKACRGLDRMMEEIVSP